jgi:hypothetical protein
MALPAPNLRRRPCYANSRLLQLPRLRWVWPHWPQPPPLPGAVMAGTAAVGTVAGMAAGVGAVPAFSSVVRPITDKAMAMAAAMCGIWFRRRGARAGAWSTAAIDPNRPIRTSKRPWPAAAGAFCPIPVGGTARRVRPVFTGKRRIRSAAGNHLRCGDLFLCHHVEMNSKRNPNG